MDISKPQTLLKEDQALVMDVDAKGKKRHFAEVSSSKEMDKPPSEDLCRRESVREMAREKGYWKCHIQETDEEIYLRVDIE